MEKIINKKNIIINNGSTSKKYALSDLNGNIIITAHYEETPEKFVVNESLNNIENVRTVDQSVFANSFSDFIDRLIYLGQIVSEDDIEKIAIRVVAPGDFFQQHREIDSEYLIKMDEVFHVASLHLKPIKQEIASIVDRLDGESKLIAISDSEFHKTLPPSARIYAIPQKIAKKLGIYRFGYHGISVSSVIREYVRRYEKSNRTIVCHLGGGSSITAVLDGKSIDTTMGYSPIEGLTMATRTGNIDPNALITIMDSEDMDEKELQNFLYKECGVKGVSGISADTRILLSEIEKGNMDAEIALNNYIYNIQKTIGAYFVALNGLDSIIFTGTIGERSAEVRRRIIEGLKSLNLSLDLSKNKLQISEDGLINTDSSVIKIAVIKTREIQEMAKICADVQN